MWPVATSIEAPRPGGRPTERTLERAIAIWLVNEREGAEMHETVDADLADLFAYSRAWSGDRGDRDVDLSFSSMLAAMVAHDQPLCRWLVGFLDRLGVDRGEITKGRSYPDAVLATNSADFPRLVTTYSFRAAWKLARDIRDLTARERPVGTRHFMAAYAVSPAFHLADFRRYRIDRREWCLELGDELSMRYPDEADGWAKYASMAPPLMPLLFDSDTPSGRDRMHLKREVESIARLIASRSTSTPLSIGVFGAWGSGKSFFLHRLRDSVSQLARESAPVGTDAEFHSRIAQVEFNAWHYSERSLVASLVAHIFRNLRVDALDEDEQELQRRGTALMLQIGKRGEALAEAGTHYEAAKANYETATANLKTLQRELPATLVEAQQQLELARASEDQAAAELEQIKEQRDESIGVARRTAQIGTVLANAGDDATAGAIGATIREVVGLANEVRSLRMRWRPIVLGLLLMIVSAAIALLARTELWSWGLSIVTALGAFAALARHWLLKASRLAELGESLDEEVAAEVTATTDRVEQRFAKQIQALEDELARRRADRAEAEERIRRASSTGEESAMVASRRDELAAAASEVARSEQALHAARDALDGLSIDTLLREFLEERATADTYESELGLLSHVRNDFERLSKLITRSNRDYLEGRRPPPTVGRIVLYIDDLDRCPEDRVVEVIQAVHLLLAFPLFVCVVAADPRWLTRCLGRAPGVRATEGMRHDVTLASQLGRQADPADYVEKIFQIPIWLRPIPVDRRAGLLRSWLEAAADPGDAATASLTDEELQFLSHLAERLDGKPRTLKRLANSYRLVRAGLSDVAFETFLVDRLQPNVDGSRHQPYRTCLTLLTVLCGNRKDAIEMAQSLDNTSATTVAEWLGELERTNCGLALFLRSAFELSELQDLVELKSWLERTRRYSFYL